LLAPLAQAVWAAERVDIGYRRGSGDHAAARVVSRRLDPLGLVLKGGVWYLAARHRGRVRSYRVNRITRAEPLGSRFERPAAFDLAAWWAASTAEFDWAILRASVELRLSPWACRHLPSTVPGDPTRQALAAGIDDGGGWRRLTLPVESEDVAFHQLLALGGGVEVLAPVTLRRRLAAEGAAMVARNATG
jgi:predicted DNA-binding transcriptional regulator YafY